ncbi:MAG: homoserine dehydrogenase [Actinomycetota bacterium]
MKRINVGLLGLGTVGSGVYKLLTRRRRDLRRLVDADLIIKRIAIKDLRELKTRPLVRVDKSIVTENARAIINDPEIDIIVEVIGGIEPAKSFILEAINNGKQVVTANKELLAKFGKDIMEASDEKGVDVYFEASVGGGIPIIRALKESLAGNKISMVMGIVNGTTNFILTKMSEEMWPFRRALEDAQRRGYAERNPRQDIEGDDAQSKIAILASIAFNARVTADQVFKEGISAITPQDIVYAHEMGYTIKLIALAKEDKDGLDVRVHPTMISKNHPLASVRDVYNAIFIEGDAVGEVMLFGQGAGSLPAASAVVGDIIEVARNLQYGRSGKVGCTCFETKRVKPIDEIVTSYYLLMGAVDKPGVLAKVARVFGDSHVSLASVIQKRTRGNLAELVFVTHMVQEKNLKQALRKIAKLDVVDRVYNVIRVEGGPGA